MELNRYENRRSSCSGTDLRPNFREPALETRRPRSGCQWEIDPYLEITGNNTTNQINGTRPYTSIIYSIIYRAQVVPSTPKSKRITKALRTDRRAEGNTDTPSNRVASSRIKTDCFITNPKYLLIINHHSLGCFLGIFGGLNVYEINKTESTRIARHSVEKKHFITFQKNFS